MSEYLTPGVYIEEVPEGPPAIIGVRTSVVAFAGWTPQGPLDRAEFVHSWKEYERKFGGLHITSLLSYSVYVFFKNGGTECYIVRVAFYNSNTPIKPNTQDFKKPLLPEDGKNMATYFPWISVPDPLKNTYNIKVAPCNFVARHY